jgi:hypothetical protein
MEIVGGKNPFNYPLDHQATTFGRRTKNWSMNGDYWTKMDEKGELYLQLEATLQAPFKLQSKYNNYAWWIIGSDEI